MLKTQDLTLIENKKHYIGGQLITPVSSKILVRLSKYDICS